MANTVDERIVEAKFDASDFERGVNKTVKKLDELKQSLHLKEAGKSVVEFAEKSSEELNKVGNTLDKLSERFTSFFGLIRQQIIQGIAGEFSNAILSIEQHLKQFVTSLSTGQIATGMNKYTEILNGVRTMVAAGVREDTAYVYIKRLGEYSDQTSYSLNQMVSGMSKLVAAGMDVKNAERSMEGLANMAASAGVSIWDANRAFMNFSQAYSSGSMRVQDWMSFESLNMATEEVMKIFMMAGEEVGTLTSSTDKKGNKTYKTSNKTNKKVSSGKQVGTSGFRDTLKYGWLDKKTMEYGTAMLSYFEDLGIDVNKLTEEELKEFAAKAYAAAKEARSFADVMGTLKDVIATGWANSFELIFGKLSEAKEFFTWLTESNLAEAIYRIGEFRNTILERWNTGGGREDMLTAIHNIDDALGELLSKFTIFGDEKDMQKKAGLLGDRLAILSRDFKQFTENMKAWLDEVVNKKTGEKRIDRIAKIFSTLGSVLTTLSLVFSVAWNVFQKTLAPILDKITDFIDNSALFNNFNSALSNFETIVKSVSGPLETVGEIIGRVAGFLLEIGLDTLTLNIELISEALGFLIEILGGTSAQQAEGGAGVIKTVSEEIQKLNDSCKEGLDAVKEFFGGLLDDLREIFGLKDDVGTEKGGFFSNISNFFETNEFVQKTKAWIDQAIQDIGKWILDIPKRLSEFAINIGDFIHGLLWEKKTKQVRNQDTGERETIEYEIKTPLNEWLTTAVENVKNWFADLPNKIVELFGKIGDFAGQLLDNIMNFLFGEKETRQGKQFNKDTQEIDRVDKEVRNSLNSGLNKTITSVKEWFSDLPNKITSGIGKVGSFLGSIWDALFYNETTVMTGPGQTKKIKVEKPLKKWLDKMVNAIGKVITDFFKNLPTYIKSFIKGAGDFLSTIISAIFGKKEEPSEMKKAADKITSDVRGSFFERVINGLKDIGLELFNQIMRIFTGSDDIEANQEAFANAVAAGIDWIRVKAEEILPKVREFFVNLPHTIAGWFSPAANDEKKETGPVGTAISGLATTIGEFIAGIPAAILEFFNSAIDEIGTLWDSLYKAFKGDNTEHLELDSDGNVIAKSLNDSAPDPNDVKVPKWEEFINSLGATISNLFANLPTFISQGLEMAVAGIDSVLVAVGDWFDGIDDDVNALLEKDSDKFGEAIKKNLSGSVSNAQKEAAQSIGAKNDKKPALLVSLRSLGDSIWTLITETIPNTLTSAWNWVRDNADKWISALGGIFDKVDAKKELSSKIAKIGEDIENLIREIPDYIKAAADWIAEIFTSGDPFSKAREEITKAFTDKDGNIIDRQGYEKALKYAEKTIHDSSKGSGLWEAIAGIGKAIGEAFGEIGPYILDGINVALEWVGTAMTKAADWMNNRDKSKGFMEDLSDTVFGDENAEGSSAIKTAITGLGETIKNLITTIIPNFLEAAFEELKVGIPRLISSIFGGNNDLIPEEVVENTTEGMETMTVALAAMPSPGSYPNQYSLEQGAKQTGDILNTVFTTFNNITNPDVLKIAAIAFGLYSISKIVDGLSILDDPGYTAKWESIKTAVMGIVGLLAYLILLSQTGNDAQLQNVYGVFDKLEEVFDHFGNFMITLQALKMGTGAMNLLGTAKGAGGFGSMLGSSLGKVAGYVLGGVTVAGVAGDIITESLADWSANITQTFEMIGLGMDDLIKSITNLASIGDKIEEAKTSVGKIGDLFKEIRGIFTVVEISTEVSVDDSFTKTKTTEYVTKNITEEFMEISRLFSKLSAVLDQFKKAITIDSPDKKTIIGDLENLLDLRSEMSLFGQFGQQQEFEDFKTALSSLGAALSLFSFSSNDIPNPDDNWIERAVAILRMLFDNDQLTSLITELSGKNTLPSENEMLTNVERMVIFAGGLVSIAEACNRLGEDSGEKISNLFTQVSSITIPKDEKFSELVISFGQLGLALSAFAQNTEELNPTNIENADAALTMLTRISTMLKDTPSTSLLSKIFTGDKSLSEFGNQIALLSADIKTFFDNIQNNNLLGKSVNYNRENLEQVISVLEVLTRSAVYISSTDMGSLYRSKGEWLVHAFGNLGQVATEIVTFVNMLNESGLDATDTSVLLNSFASMCEQMASLNASLSSLYVKRIGSYSGDVTAISAMDALGPIIESFNQDSDKIKEFLNNMATLNTTGIENAETLFSGLSDLANALLKFSIKGGDGIPEAYEGLRNLFNLNWTELTIVKDKVLDVFKPSEFFVTGKSAGENLDAGIAEGLNSRGKAYETAQALANKISDVFVFAWEMESPSKLFARFGEYLDEGLAIGIKNYSNLPVSNAEEMAQSVAGNVSSILAKVGSLPLDTANMTPTVTPVLNMDQLNNGSLWELLESNRQVQLNLNSPQIEQYMDDLRMRDYTGALTSLDSNIGSMKTTIDTMNETVGNLKVFMSTGELVGVLAPYIDAYIGENYVISERTNV